MIQPAYFKAQTFVNFVSKTDHKKRNMYEVNIFKILFHLKQIFNCPSFFTINNSFESHCGYLKLDSNQEMVNTGNTHIIHVTK